MIRSYTIYYEEEKSQLDSLQIKLRKRGVVEFAEAAEVILSDITWTKSPSWEEDTHTPSMEIVITSYSIHYTKLYERFFSIVMLGAL